MVTQKLTFRSVEVRMVVVPLRHPIVSKIGEFAQWPLLLIDLRTEEGIVGRSYLGPYIEAAARSIVPAIQSLGEMRTGKRIRPTDDFAAGRKALTLMGHEGVTMIALSGLDMAAWDAIAKAAGIPLVDLLGGSTGSVKAYNSNGLWLSPVEQLAEEAHELVTEGGFKALKLRLGRNRLADDLQAIDEVRSAAGADVELMVDFNQGLSLGDAMKRCRTLDDCGLCWLEEPICYDNLAGYALLARELRTPVQLGENFYGPRVLHQALSIQAGDCVMPDLMRIGGVTGWLRAAAIAGGAGIPMSSHLYPEFSAHLLRVTETADWLEWQDWADPILEQPFEVGGGHVTVPNRAGAGSLGMRLRFGAIRATCDATRLPVTELSG